jgi:hypothetical protein
LTAIIWRIALASLNHTCRNLVPTFPQRSPPSLLTRGREDTRRHRAACQPANAGNGDDQYHAHGRGGGVQTRVGNCVSPSLENLAGRPPCKFVSGSSACAHEPAVRFLSILGRSAVAVGWWLAFKGISPSGRFRVAKSRMSISPDRATARGSPRTNPPEADAVSESGGRTAGGARRGPLEHTRQHRKRKPLDNFLVLGIVQKIGSPNPKNYISWQLTYGLR